MRETLFDKPVTTNDAVILGILMLILALVFKTASLKSGGFQKFYSIVPPVLLCYLIPGVLNSIGFISGSASNLYFVASRYLLPSSLVLFTLSLDLKEIWKIRHKAGAMFLTGSASIVIGGPLAILIVSCFAPQIVGGAGPDAVWRGLATLAGTWIGGGANQLALYEVFKPNPNMFSALIAVDVILGGLWMAFLLYGAANADKMDRLLNADTQTVHDLIHRLENKQQRSQQIPNLTDYMVVVGLAFSVTGFAHFFSDLIVPVIKLYAPNMERFSLTSGFFWLVITATIIGTLLSFTKVRHLETVGASRIGTVFLYIMVTTIGMQMDITAVFDSPGLFVVGLIWLLIHIVIMFVVARLIRAPFFFLAIGSDANIGGAASTPVIAGIFNAALAPVGVLLAIFGLAIGTYAGYICAILMQIVSPHV